MAGCAVLQIQGTAALSGIVRRQRSRPRKIVRVDVVQRGFRIERLTAPFGSAVVAWKNNRVLPNRKRNECAVAAERAELVDRPLARLGRARRQHVLREELPG